MDSRVTPDGIDGHEATSSCTLQYSHVATRRLSARHLGSGAD